MPRTRLARKPSQAERAQTLLVDQGMLRLSEFKAKGIAEETLARLVREGRLVRVARGLYQRPNVSVEASHSLAEAAKLVPKGVVCLISALQFHGLTTQVPSRIWMALPRTASNTAWAPNVRYPPLRFVHFSDKGFRLDIETHKIEHVSVRIYGVAKTIVDCFRFRNKIGTEVALEALRGALDRRLCSVAQISKLANELRALKVMRPYLEAAAT
jgi:predicted transcriptional regulator of viral defense system